MADARDQQWWHGCDKETFEQRLSEMHMRELHELSNELGANATSIHGQLSKHNPDEEWRRRAIRAVAHIGERRALIKAELAARDANNRNKNYDVKKRMVANARALIASGDVGGALEVLLKWFDPDIDKDGCG